MKEEEIRQRSVLNRYLELVAEDVRTIFQDHGLFQFSYENHRQKTGRF